MDYNIKPNLVLYSLYYAEAAVNNEFAGPISASMCPGNTALFEEMSQGGEALATLCSIRPAVDINFRLPVPETNALPLDRNWPVFFFTIP